MSPIHTDLWLERRGLMRRAYWPVLVSLLPAAALGILAWTSLQADRRWAENDAQERAQAAIEHTATALTHALTRDLDIYRRAALTGSSISTNPSPELAQFLLRFPDLSRSSLTSPILRLATNGTLLQPRPYDAIPIAPPWFRDLATHGANAWSGLADPFETQDIHENTSAVAWGRGATVKPEMATLIELQQVAMSRKESASGPFETLESLHYPAVITPGGLPWSVQYYGDWCRFQRAQPRAFPEVSVLSNLVSRVPSALTSYFLEDARNRATTASERRTVDELSATWEADERRREVAVAWLKTERSMDVAPSWLDVGTESWLVRAENKIAEGVPPTIALEILPHWILTRIVREELRTLNRAVPAGISQEVTLAGRILTDRAHTPTAVSRLAMVSAFIGIASATGPPTRLEVAALLTDPEALFARTRQRRRLFGGLVGLSLLIAALGAWLSARAIRRQELLAEQRGNFVAAVSHELRAPIAGVRLLAENLERDRVPTEEKRREYYALISRETRRLSQLIANVLDFGRLERRQISYLPAPADLRGILHESAAILQPLATEREVTFNLILPNSGTTTSLTVDAPALQRALVNLFDNALKHSPPGGVVTVTLRALAGPPPQWEVTVVDQGPGIPPADQRRIFEPFVRLGSELRRETPGVGLGLALATHIARGHGGTVEVESRVGAGSTFRLRLPHNPPR